LAKPEIKTRQSEGNKRQWAARKARQQSEAEELARLRALANTSEPSTQPQNAKSKHRGEGGGAPRGMRGQTQLRIDLLAAARAQGLGPKDVYSELRFKGTAQQQYTRAYGFSSEYKAAITSRAQQMEVTTAPQIRKAAREALLRLNKNSSQES